MLRPQQARAASWTMAAGECALPSNPLANARRGAPRPLPAAASSRHVSCTLWQPDGVEDSARTARPRVAGQLYCRYWPSSDGPCAALCSAAAISGAWTMRGAHARRDGPAAGEISTSHSSQLWSVQATCYRLGSQQRFAEVKAISPVPAGAVEAVVASRRCSIRRPQLGGVHSPRAACTDGLSMSTAVVLPMLTSADCPRKAYHLQVCCLAR